MLFINPILLLGTEFTFGEVVAHLRRNNCIIHQKGSKESKLGIVEAMIKEIRKLIRPKLSDLFTSKQWFEEFRKVVKLYNNSVQGHSALNGQNPQEYLGSV